VGAGKGEGGMGRTHRIGQELLVILGELLHLRLRCHHLGPFLEGLLDEFRRLAMRGSGVCRCEGDGMARL
jgi:hypothetical protein